MQPASNANDMVKSRSGGSGQSEDFHAYGRWKSGSFWALTAALNLHDVIHTIIHTIKQLDEVIEENLAMFVSTAPVDRLVSPM